MLSYRQAVFVDLEVISSIEMENQLFPQTKKQLERYLLKPYEMFIFEEDLQTVGFTVLQNIFPECELLNISIEKRHQNQGKGKWFLTKIIEQLQDKKYQKLYLEVRQSNLSAQKLYESLGFRYNSTRINYYPTQHGREDAKLYLLEF